MVNWRYKINVFCQMPLWHIKQSGSRLSLLLPLSFLFLGSPSSLVVFILLVSLVWLISLVSQGLLGPLCSLIWLISLVSLVSFNSTVSQEFTKSQNWFERKHVLFSVNKAGKSCEGLTYCLLTLALRVQECYQYFSNRSFLLLHSPLCTSIMVIWG